MTDHIEVVGTGTAVATPDVVVLDVRVSTEADDVAGALGALTDRLDGAMQAAADHGVAAADRRTTGMGLVPRWHPERQRTDGFTASQSVRLRVRDRDRLGDLVAALAGAAGDALGIDGVTAEVADPGPLRERARAAAFADAWARAGQYAGLAGRHLGPVLRVTEETGEPGGHAPQVRLAAAETAPGVETGSTEIAVVARVRFALGPA
ncbi:SIMPL domain-containing protein [Phycicoccus sp. CSK15P-2]|uniref:SIMPL domain-containing protein n=1 Tax=Phycicoccus sp. CSK15P-2 TaxID=2807627 RepID=UPI00194E2EE1|nr:SIMPL domain-containing protein [Phycicoccus sp. CSK15P-2]MBM6404347.1 SIMPL domain-containing protein [Phycicoccus sp. CSK15P-2]